MDLLKLAGLAVTLAALSAPCASQNLALPTPHRSVVDGFVVTTGDISDRPYVEVGSVTATASTVNWAKPLSTDIDAKLRAKAKKMGADAVVRVRLSGAPSGMVNWGGLKGTGVAVKFPGPEKSTQ